MAYAATPNTDPKARMLALLGTPKPAMMPYQPPASPQTTQASPYQAPTSAPAQAPAPTYARTPMPTAYSAQSAPAPTAAPQNYAPSFLGMSSPNTASSAFGGAFANGGSPFGGRAAQPYQDPFGYLNPEHRQGIEDFFHSLAGIDYKGSHESALMRKAQLAQLFGMWENEPDIDYSGAAPIGRQFERGRGQLQSRLAAQGLSGGVAAGAMGDSYSREGDAIGDYIRRLMAQRQEQHHGDMTRFLDYSRDLDKIGLGQNINEQNQPGFWDDLLGVGLGVAGKLIL